MAGSLPVEIMGVIGGICLALSFIPQVLKTYRTKSAGDISYTFQGIYIFGTSLLNAYAITLHLWSVYIPGIMEEVFIVTLTVMKYMYDRKTSDDDAATTDDDSPALKRMSTMSSTHSDCGGCIEDSDESGERCVVVTEA